MCVLAGVSRAGYYRHWAASAPRVEETAVRDAILRLAPAHRHYGYRRIAAQLRREGFAVNRKRVLRLMQQDNLLCLRQKPFVPVTTDSRHTWRVVSNLARGMVPSGLDQLSVADITYIRLREEFAYLAIVLDAFSRRVVGWALETHLEARLALAALSMALAADARRRHTSPRVDSFAIQSRVSRRRASAIRERAETCDTRTSQLAPYAGYRSILA